MIQRPAPLPLPDLRQIPALVWLTDPMHRRWIVWRWVWNNKLGKWDKPPFQINGSHAASDDPETWVDYDTAVAEVEAGRFDGVGLMLHGLPAEYLAAIDLDNVRDPATGELLPWAQTLVTTSRSYCEVTPSGCGIRILGTAKGIDTLHRNGPHPGGGRFELFLNCKRYITVSGQQIGTSELADDTVQVMALQAMLGQAPRPATNGQTTEGIDRSLEFFRALRTLKGHGHSEVQVLAALEAVGKYGGRLGTEFARAWGKLGGVAPQEEPPVDRWPSEPALEPAQARKARLLAVQLDRTPIARIAPRPWAYGSYLLTGHAAVLGAKDGVGKGAIATGIALSFITGKPLLGEKVWTPGPVAIVTYEDDKDEWHRRFAAACLHYGLDYDEVLADLYFLTFPDRKVVLAALREGRTIFPDGDEIVETLRAIRAVNLQIDPLNHAHDLQDGNSNVLIAQLALEIDRIAREAWVAALVLHHLRKGASGDPDDLMGATSLRATFRSSRILARMDPETAKKMEVEEPWRYVRIAGSKENYAPPPDKATWYRLHSVRLENGTDLYPDGDSIGVAARWAPPAPFGGLPWEAIIAVLETIDAGTEEGERYSPNRQAKRWAGHLLTAKGRTPEQAAGIISRWLDEGVLAEVTYQNRQRNEVRGLTVSAPKLGEMRAAAEVAPGLPDDC